MQRLGLGEFDAMRALLLLLILALPLWAQEISGGGGGAGGGVAEELTTACDDGETLVAASGVMDCGTLPDIDTGSDITTGLVHHWDMEGDCTNDEGSAAQDLTLNNAPTCLSAGCAVGTNCLDLNGSDEYGETTTSPTAPTGDVTYALWFRTEGNDDTILAIADPNVTNLYVGGDLGIDVYLVNVIENDVASIVTVNTWYHLGVVRKAGTIQIYIDGVAGPVAPATKATLNFSTCQYLIGVDPDGGCEASLGNYFDGQLDDIRIYSRALSAADIAALYALGN